MSAIVARASVTHASSPTRAPAHARASRGPNALRSRLAQVSLLASVPLFLLLLAGALQDRAHVLDGARAHVLELARLGAQRQDEVVQEAASLVLTLGRVPDIAQATPGACHRILKEIARDHPRIDSLVVARRDGTIPCYSRSEDKTPITIGDRPYFRAAIAPGALPYVVSDLVVSRGTERPSVIVAAALPGDPAPGAVVAAVWLNWFVQLVRDDSPELVARLVGTRSGAVLARSPPGPPGPLPDGDPLLTALRAARGTTTLDVTESDGVRRLLGVAPLRGRAAGFVLVVGVDSGAVAAQADARLRRGAAIALAAMSAALLLALAFARWSLLKPIEALAGAAWRIGGGDLGAHAELGPRVAPELRTLAEAFNTMADRLAETRASLAESELHHRVLAESASDMITRFGPDFRRTYVSPASRELIGRDPSELVGQSPGGIVHPDDWPLLDATLNRPLQRGEPTSRATYRAIHKDGRSIWLESIGRRLPGGEGFVVVTRDVSARIELEEQLRAANDKLEALVMEDGLTGLANRRCFDAALLQELRQAERARLPLAVAVIDVDHFKAYNDSYGHPAGDRCLQAVARAISGALRRAGDLAARWGGEEFVVLLPATGGSNAERVAETIRAAVRGLDLPHRAGIEGRVTVSVGAASRGRVTADDGPDLIAAADAALYAAKQSGRNRVVLAAAREPGTVP
jgi:diguanylate cyclase (GGDEF)-like protein/PAS domain S-box-containing protein